MGLLALYCIWAIWLCYFGRCYYGQSISTFYSLIKKVTRHLMERKGGLAAGRFCSSVWKNLTHVILYGTTATFYPGIASLCHSTASMRRFLSQQQVNISKLWLSASPLSINNQTSVTQRFHCRWSNHSKCEIKSRNCVTSCALAH